ncbi:MAG: hypothetical protein AB8F26_04755 [Phycisphaerales bacterium]
MANIDPCRMCEIGVRSDDDLLTTGRRITSLLQVNEFEVRDGINIGGGEYVRFFLDECECYLIDNRNEDVHIDELSEFEFYIWGEATEPDESGSVIALWNQVAQSVTTALTRAGIDLRVNSG